MKKFYLIGIFLCALLQAHAQLLQKVVNYPGQSYESHWNFNTAGQLTDIRKPDNTLMEDFTYDASGNLTIRNIYVTLSGFGTGTQTFTYDANNRIASVNDIPVTYNADSNYYMTVENSGDMIRTRYFYLNAEGLIVSDFGEIDYSGEIKYEEGIWQTHYSNNNMTYNIYYDANAENHWEYVAIANPVKPQVMANLRALVVTSLGSPTGKWSNPFYASDWLEVHNNHGMFAPESSDYYYQLNDNGKPSVKYCKAYYFDDLEWENIAAIYYYQGDVIP